MQIKRWVCVFRSLLDSFQVTSSDLCHVYSRRDGDFCKSLVSPLISTAGGRSRPSSLSTGSKIVSGPRCLKSDGASVTSLSSPTCSSLHVRRLGPAPGWQGLVLARDTVFPKHVCESQALTWRWRWLGGPRTGGSSARTCLRPACIPGTPRRAPSPVPSQEEEACAHRSRHRPARHRGLAPSLLAAHRRRGPRHLGGSRWACSPTETVSVSHTQTDGCVLCL